MSVSENQAKTIFLAALEIDSQTERGAFIDARCGDDVSLLQAVERLLLRHDDVGSFLESPPPGVEVAPTVDQPIAEQPGTQIGPYKLLQKIGEGGFGVVYMAEQTKPIRRQSRLESDQTGHGHQGGDCTLRSRTPSPGS